MFDVVLLNSDNLFKLNTFMLVQQYVKVLRFARLKIASWVSPMIKLWYSDWCFLLNSFVLPDKLLKYNIFMCGHQHVKDFYNFQDWIAGDDSPIPHFFILSFISLLTIFQPTPSHVSCFTTFWIQWCDSHFLPVLLLNTMLPYASCLIALISQRFHSFLWLEW
jgi:hypothetical protein